MHEWRDHIRREFWKRMMKTIPCSKAEWRSMSCHPFLTEKMVMNNLSHPWDWRALSRQEFGKLHRSLLRMPEKDWDWIHLSSVAPLEFIIQHPRLGWSYRIVYDRMNPPRIPSRPLRIEVIMATTPNRELDWRSLSTVAPLGFILAHRTLSWKWKVVTRRPDMSFRILHLHPNVGWDLSYAMQHLPFGSHHLRVSPFLLDFALLSLNPYLTRSVLRQHIHRPWDWKGLARHPAFRPEVIFHDALLRPFWRWDHCLLHPRISWKFYHIVRREFTITHHFSLLSKNHFQVPDAYHRAVLYRFLLTHLVRLRIQYHLRLLRFLSPRIPCPLFPRLLEFV